MKILLLTTHLNTGGIGIYTVTLAKYLVRQGMDVIVASGGGTLEAVLAGEGITHLHLDIRTKADLGIKVMRAAPALTRIVRENDIQVVHAQTRVTQVTAALSARATGVPFVSTCHGFFKHRRLSRRLFPCWGDKVIAISKSVQKHLVEDFGVEDSRIVQVYNGIELGRYRVTGDAADTGLARSLGIEAGNTVVGTVGRLSPVKGFRYLIRAFAKAVSEDAGLRLVIVGEGPEKTALENLAAKLDVTGKVVFTPGGRDLERYFGLMDIFCLPSVHEGLGLSLMEAMAAGRACIASDVGGLSELISHGKDGILVPSCDPESLAESITRFASDAGMRGSLADNAAKKAMDSFSIEESARKTAEVYRSIAA